MVRAAATKISKTITLLLNTKGPEMRLGLFKDGKATLEKGQNFILTSRDIEGKMGICP